MREMYKKDTHILMHLSMNVNAKTCDDDLFSVLDYVIHMRLHHAITHV